jgi:hypothetical protein
MYVERGRVYGDIWDHRGGEVSELGRPDQDSMIDNIA